MNEKTPDRPPVSSEQHVNSEDSEEEGSDKVPKHRDRLCTGIFMPPSKEAQNSADDSAA